MTKRNTSRAAAKPRRASSPAIPSTPAETTRARPVTEFLNVDLDVWSRSNLTALADAFDGCVLYCDRISRGRGYIASFETNASLGDADRTIRALVRAVAKLRGEPLRLWNRATRRDFNIGIQAGAEPHTFQFAVRPETLRSVVEVGGRIVVTVYVYRDETAGS